MSYLRGGSAGLTFLDVKLAVTLGVNLVVKRQLVVFSPTVCSVSRLRLEVIYSIIGSGCRGLSVVKLLTNFSFLGLVSVKLIKMTLAGRAR